MSLRDQILTCDDLPKECVHVPEWGVDVYVRTMTGEERDAYDYALWQAKEQGGDEAMSRVLRPRLIASTVCDEAGKLLFTAGDYVALMRKSSSALGRLFEVAQRLNGTSQAAIEEKAGKS